jgi:hypothetical protein
MTQEHGMLGASIKLVKYNIDLVEFQEVRWDKGGSQPADEKEGTS